MNGSSSPPKIRASRTGIWRAGVLLGVHVVLIGHVLWWYFSGRAMTPLEPSEGMQFSKEGILNAGLVLFAVAGLATLVFGRFFCGWACHMVALQDACRWLMLKFGVRPMPLRSRLLRWVPLGAFFYMYLWPVVARWISGAPSPGIRGAEWTTNALWATFPSVTVSIIGLVVCGLLTVWFLGSKGLCVYACPYGALFGAADAFAPGRIRVNDNCEGCGHCTAVCSSDVQVAREVAEHGMVVDPGCLKCMDCVSVCPMDALSFGFGKPAALTDTSAAAAPRPKSAPTWVEEASMAAGFLLFFFATRTLYGQVPFLVALSLGVIGGWAVLMLIRLYTQRNLRSGPWQWKRDGSLTRPGQVAAGLLSLWMLFGVHSAVVQVHSFRRSVAFEKTGVWRTKVLRQGVVLPEGEVADALAEAADAARRSRAWGLLRDERDTYVLAFERAAANDPQGFESHLNEILEHRPGFGETLFQLGHFQRATGRRDQAKATWASISHRDARYLDAQIDLGITMHQDGEEEGSHLILDRLRDEGFHAHELHDLAAALSHEHG